MFWPALLSLLLLTSGDAIAQEVAAHVSDPWYKVVVGIIAIPGAAIGLLVSWNMMQKARLETKKLEIEIAEKQQAISRESSPAEKLELIASPLGESRRALLIIIRFVLLDVTLRLWNFVPSLVSFIGQAVAAGFFLTFGAGAFKQSSLILIGAAPEAINALLAVVYWLIVFGFGWPLFKDTCAFLNIPVKSLFDLPRIGWTRTSSG